MQQTAMVANAIEPQYDRVLLDLLRTVFHLKISRYHIAMTQEHNLWQVDNQLLINTDKYLEALIKDIKGRLPKSRKGAEWLELEFSPSSDKLFMAATLVEMVARIGVQEGDHYYEEFTDLVVSLLDEVFYAQNARKKLHFGKYKALFELIRTEIRADINRTPEHYDGQMMFKDKAIWIRTTPQISHSSQIQ